MWYRRRLDWFIEWNDNKRDKERIREVVICEVEKILDANIQDITENEIKKAYIMVDVDLQMELRESPKQFKIACQSIINDLLALFD